ncbi:MAG: CPBP family intramembrane metalloprotease [Microcystis aeruginosa Ma_AC_P_19900807_S299]|nr:MAG: CPBP family intramembrane metalloprotease [Microcystis aeruginosa Ma_AC_P_19900807_S299]
MFDNFSKKLPWQSLKQAIAFVLTIIALTPVVTALISSVNQPQIQSNIQLYQTNINLQATTLSSDADPNSEEFANLKLIQTSLIGEAPYTTAEEQYLSAQKSAKKTITELEKSAVNPEQKKSLEREINSLKDLELKLSLIQASQGDLDWARQIWQDIKEKSEFKNYKPAVLGNALLLEGLYSEPPQIAADAEARIERNFQGWFRYTILEKLYSLENRQEDLLALEPLIGGLIGVVLLIFLLVQWLLRQQRSLLFLDDSLAWQTKWGGETLWWGIIIGFFFVGQIVLPVIFVILSSFLSLNPEQFNLEAKAIYVVVSYLALTVSSLSVLYLAIKPFRPLPRDWFRFNLFSPWLLWGLAGYFVALPLVIIVSLLNQLIWQGQGGSNPLLTLALESQNTFALLCFAFTASLAAPFFEEIVFRGFLLASLTRYLPVWAAIALSSLIFALAHQNLSEVLPLTVLGCVLGFVYTRSKNLLSSMLVHSLWNGGTLLSLFLLGSGAG